jgi:hypothetical protein
MAGEDERMLDGETGIRIANWMQVILDEERNGVVIENKDGTETFVPRAELKNVIEQLGCGCMIVDKKRQGVIFLDEDDAEVFVSKAKLQDVIDQLEEVGRAKREAAKSAPGAN